MTHPDPAKARYIAQFWNKQRPLVLNLYRETQKQIKVFGSITTKDDIALRLLANDARASFRKMKGENLPKNLSKFKKKRTNFLNDLKQANKPDFTKVIKILQSAYRQ